MKKTLVTFLSLIFIISTLAGCSSKSTSGSGSAIVKVGLGHITSIAKSTDLGVKDGKDVLPVAQVDTVIAAVAFDKDGKVVKVTIDNAQTKVEFQKDLTLKSDPKAVLKTKVELKEEYGMLKSSTIKKEWYQQAVDLEKWMIGKTVVEIKAMKTVKKDDAHPAVPDVSELKSLVSISVQDYIAAVEEAFKNAVTVKAGTVKVGLGHQVSLASSKALGKDKDGKEVLPVGQVDATMAAAAFDKDGKVVTVVIDNAQTKVAYSKDGKVTSDLKAAVKTKVELGDAYGMAKTSLLKKEWYQQIADLQKWMVGKKVEEIKAMKTVNKDATHPAVPDVAELKSLVSISVQDYIASTAEAFANAK